MKDSNRRFDGGSVTKVPNIIDPTTFEVMAILEALGWIRHRRKTHFVVESDYLQAVNWIQNREFANTTLREFVLDFNSLLTTFSYVRLDFVRKTMDHAAHNLARVASSLLGFHV